MYLFDSEANTGQGNWIKSIVGWTGGLIKGDDDDGHDDDCYARFVFERKGRKRLGAVRDCGAEWFCFSENVGWIYPLSPWLGLEKIIEWIWTRMWMRAELI
jgi:hypothetical protein